MKGCLVESPGTAPGSEPLITGAFIPIVALRRPTVYRPAQSRWEGPGRRAVARSLPGPVGVLRQRAEPPVDHAMTEQPRMTCPDGGNHTNARQQLLHSRKRRPPAGEEGEGGSCMGLHPVGLEEVECLEAHRADPSPVRHAPGRRRSVGCQPIVPDARGWIARISDSPAAASALTLSRCWNPFCTVHGRKA